MLPLQILLSVMSLLLSALGAMLGNESPFLVLNRTLLLKK